MRVLQDLTQAFQTLVRLWPDFGLGSWFSKAPGGPRPLTVLWSQATDTSCSVYSTVRLHQDGPGVKGDSRPGIPLAKLGGSASPS